MKRLIYSVTVVIAATAFFIKANDCAREEKDDLVLANVEALAQDESGSNGYFCVGTGNLVCPDTGKLVAAYYTRRSLE